MMIEQTFFSLYTLPHSSIGLTSCISIVFFSLNNIGPYDQVRDMTAFAIHFFILHHIKITIHLPYCNHKLVYNYNTRINYTLEDYVIFSGINL